MSFQTPGCWAPLQKRSSFFMEKKYGLFTNDVETTSIWFNALRDETGLKVMREGMPVLLDIYARHGIRSTFYFTGYIAKRYPQVVSMILRDGHEVGLMKDRNSTWNTRRSFLRTFRARRSFLLERQPCGWEKTRPRPWWRAGSESIARWLPSGLTFFSPLGD